jgi:methyl-accepting chemotaxis protein
MWIAIGVACLVVAGGLVPVFVALARLFTRADGTLAKVERQLDEAKAPLSKTLHHVSGIAGSIDDIASRIDHTAEAADRTASAVARAAESAQAAVTPTLANLVGIVAGVSQGAKAFFRSRGRNGSQADE